MSLELFTGGNIRLEEGRPPPSSLLTSAVAAAAARPGPGGSAAAPLSGAASALAGVTPSSLAGDVWYSTCADLVRSRFSAADFAPLHVTGVRVLRAIRVHNRYLRSRFEKRITHVLGLQVGARAASKSLSMRHCSRVLCSPDSRLALPPGTLPPQVAQLCPPQAPRGALPLQRLRARRAQLERRGSNTSCSRPLGQPGAWLRPSARAWQTRLGAARRASGLSGQPPLVLERVGWGHRPRSWGRRPSSEALSPC